MPPKRKADDDAEKAAKKAKPNTAPEIPTRRSPRSKSKSTDPPAPEAESSDSEEDKNEAPGEEWAIEGDYSRDAFVVGKAEPLRLSVTLRGKISGSRKFTFKLDTGEDVDWNNPEHIRKANKYFNNLFTRLGFPPKVAKNLWMPYENAWLEIMLQKLSGAIPKGYKSKPHMVKLLEAFNKRFEGRTDLLDQKGQSAPARPARDKSSFGSFVNRKTGTLRAMRDAVKDQLKDKSAGAWIPDITDAEIDAHLNGKTATAGGGTAAPKDTATTKSNTITKSGASTLSNAGKGKSHDNPEASTTGRDKDHFEAPTPDGEDIDMPDSPESPADKCPDHSHSQSESLGEYESRSTKVAGQSVQKITTEEEFAKLRAEGWSVPDLPATDEEALRRHRESAKNVVEDDDAWPISAELALDERLSRRPVEASSYYERNTAKRLWTQDRLPDEKTKAEQEQELETTKEDGEATKDSIDKEESLERRQPTAATTNAVLGYATIPPFGYQGDVRALRNDPRMPESEQVLAETSDAALRKLHEEHDKAFKHYRALVEKEDDST